MDLNDVSLAIDMDDLGIRPQNWTETNKSLRNSFEDLFGQEKTIDFTVYSAELQLTTDGKTLTKNENEVSMSDDDGNNDYDIDPETGEKIFREAPAASNISLSSPNNQWIEEYLSNIESSSSNQVLPSSEFLENFSFPLIENPTDITDSDWFSNLINLDENSVNTMFTEPIVISDENTSNHITTDDNRSSLSVSVDDEYSTSSNSNDNEIRFIETKLEKIDHDEDALSHMMIRRTSIRSTYQGQQDENALITYDIPLSLNDITQSSTEEYNRHLTRLSNLSTEQIHIIKDIRRRGKNKVAAQNCRKRKAISVESLLEEVDELKRVKHELEERKRTYQQQINETRNQYEYLHRQVLPDRQLPPAIIVK